MACVARRALHLVVDRSFAVLQERRQAAGSVADDDSNGEKELAGREEEGNAQDEDGAGGLFLANLRRVGLAAIVNLIPQTPLNDIPIHQKLYERAAAFMEAGGDREASAMNVVVGDGGGGGGGGCGGRGGRNNSEGGAAAGGLQLLDALFEWLSVTAWDTGVRLLNRRRPAPAKPFFDLSQQLRRLDLQVEQQAMRETLQMAEKVYPGVFGVAAAAAAAMQGSAPSSSDHEVGEVGNGGPKQPPPPPPPPPPPMSSQKICPADGHPLAAAAGGNDLVGSGGGSGAANQGGPETAAAAAAAAAPLPTVAVAAAHPAPPPPSSFSTVPSSLPAHQQLPPQDDSTRDGEAGEESQPHQPQPHQPQPHQPQPKRSTAAYEYGRAKVTRMACQRLSEIFQNLPASGIHFHDDVILNFFIAPLDVDAEVHFVLST